MLRSEDGEILKDSQNKPMQIERNKHVNAHNDLCFSDDGVQLSKDSACPNLPASTSIIGESQTITFER